MTSEYWEIQLQGDIAALNHLAANFSGTQICVCRDAENTGFVLRHHSMAGLDNAQAVRDAAQPFLAMLRGILKSVTHLDGALETGAVYRRRPNGGLDITVFPETIMFKLIGQEVATVVRNHDGAALKSPQAITAAIAAIGDRVATVGKVFRLLSRDDAGTPTGLYRIGEAIAEDCKGLDNVVALGWTTRNRYKLFTHSTNSVAAFGDDARHGSESTEPPPKPMSIHEVQNFMEGLLSNWISFIAQREK